VDSLTQIVLGASVGELCLSKKIGNKAMLWGAVAGTIPDLDVLANPFMSRAESLAFHRGISHSFFFSVLGAFVFAWLVHSLYKKTWHLKFEKIFASSLMFFVALILCAIGVMLKSNLVSLIIYILIIAMSWWFYQKRIIGSYTKSISTEHPDYKDWVVLFFFGFVTHIILDSLTAYGTQLFAPFSDVRIAFANISVADLFYTIPFLTGLIISSLQSDFKKKRWWNYAGIIISSLYMIWTIFHRQQITTVLENTIESKELEYKKYSITPSILQNFLWSATIETDTSFYHGTYSDFDKEKIFKTKEVLKNHHLIADAKDDDKTINILKWFTNDYYMCLVRQDGRVQLNDMRYGTFRGSDYGEDDFIFKFILEKDSKGYYFITDEAGRPSPEDREAMMPLLIERIKGI